MNDLRVSPVQSNLIWEDPQANLNHFEKMLRPLKGTTDLIVLPEMFTTGFSMNAEKLAETMDGKTVEWLKNQATTLSAAIMGSCIIKEEDQYYNRLLFVKPDGSVDYYDKRHLFTFAGEHEYFTAGTTRKVFQYNDWKIKPLICYDLRFPVWSRNTEKYDLLVYVANFPDKRHFAWTQLLTARAIENQVFTVGVNRVGADGNDITYSGDTAVFDYLGHLLADLHSDEVIRTLTLSYTAQQEFRRQFAFLQDGDLFELNV